MNLQIIVLQCEWMCQELDVRRMKTDEQPPPTDKSIYSRVPTTIFCFNLLIKNQVIYLKLEFLRETTEGRPPIYCRESY